MIRPAPQTLRTQLATLERDHAELEAKYAATERERDALYEKFESMVRRSRARARDGGMDGPRRTAQTPRAPLLSMFYRGSLRSPSLQVESARERADAKSALLERRLGDVEHEYVVRRAQVQEVMVAHAVPASTMAAIGGRLDAALESRAGLLRELQHNIAVLTKAHNDTARVLAARLRDMGLPPAEVAYALIPSATGVAPAGLVSRPGIM